MLSNFDTSIRLISSSLLIVLSLSGCKSNLSPGESYRAGDAPPLTHDHAGSSEKDVLEQEARVFSGGEGTSFRRPDVDAYSHPATNLSSAGELDFRVGNGLFRRNWVSSPSSSATADGLGPLFNERSCQSCHIKDGRGLPPELPEVSSATLRLQNLSPENEAGAFDGDPIYGQQLNTRAIQGVFPEGELHVVYEEIAYNYPDGSTVKLRRPSVKPIHLGYGNLAEGSNFSLRQAPPVFGLGLLEAIPEGTLLSASDPNDIDGDGVSGRANMIDGKVGRFGWKAQSSSLKDQTSKAFQLDLGISTSAFPHHFGDCTPAQSNCLTQLHGGDDQFNTNEVSDEMVDLITQYLSSLAVPARRISAEPIDSQGEQLFSIVGCASCHTPKQQTGSSYNPANSDQTIWPYSDLLLHDMGDELADLVSEGGASGREWRTPPLWGIGLTKVVNPKATFLHDGRARTLEEAILWHGGEAERSRLEFADLSEEERRSIIAFLESL